jgi:hypothetical protein
MFSPSDAEDRRELQALRHGVGRTRFARLLSPRVAKVEKRLEELEQLAVFGDRNDLALVVDSDGIAVLVRVFGLRHRYPPSFSAFRTRATSSARRAIFCFSFSELAFAISTRN